MNQNQIRELQEILDEGKRIVFFTGAGVSTESGIPDFRSQDGLYHQSYQYPPETIISHSFFMQNTSEFYRFYKDRMLFLDAKPNATHTFIAKMEETGRSLGVITQNIDGLHSLAGSKHVYELHGSVHRNYCMKCHTFYPLETIVESQGIPTCKCGGIIKPDVVLYEEPLDAKVTVGAIEAIKRADVLVVLGTSLVVYPAAGFLNYFHGEKLVLINRDATTYDAMADLHIQGNLKDVFPHLQVR